MKIACGTSREGYESVERSVLLWFPWPWRDGSMERIYCERFAEYLPAREVEEDRDLNPDAMFSERRKHVGKDFFLAFADECWRVMAPGARAEIVVPAQSCDRAYRDPTVRRFFAVDTFSYLSKRGRERLGAAHYRVDCDFDVHVSIALDQGLAMLPVDKQQAHVVRSRNAVMEYRVSLAKRET